MRSTRIRLGVLAVLLALTIAPFNAAAQTQSTLKIFLPIVLNNYDPNLAFDGPDIPFGYGWGVFDWRKYWPVNPQYPATSFNWIKITENPDPQFLCGPYRLPYNVLLRLNKADANATPQQVADDTWTWAQNLKAIPGRARCVDAFEIGNEPNLSMTGAFGGPVNPELYADQLCKAHEAIKNTDPAFIVVAAGLAPTAGLPDPSAALTDTIFLRRMLDRIVVQEGNAGACFDVLAYHNYGFRTGYATAPTSTACAARSCYRGVEEIFQILRYEYGVRKRIWATEIGWLRDFVGGGCGGAGWAPFFGGWQRSDTDQGTQLVSAYQYSRDNWPWMGAMFVFNSDFDRRPQDNCQDEQGWFAVKGRVAETMLEAMPKP